MEILCRRTDLLGTYALYGIDRTNVQWAFFHWDTPQTRHLGQLAFGLAGLVCLGGAWLWSLSAAHLPEHVLYEREPQALAVVQTGPYRFIRHPMYAGVLLLTIGFGFFESRLGFSLLLVTSFIFIAHLIALEEQVHRAKLSAGYLDYERRVHALIPALHSEESKQVSDSHWLEGLANAIPAWGVGLTTFGFVVFMNDAIGTRFAEGSIVLSVLHRVFAERRANARDEFVNASGPDIVIRPVLPSDAGTWESMRRALWPDGADEHATEIAMFFSGHSFKHLAATLVAESRAGKLVGFAELSIRDDLEGLEGGRTGYVEGLYVLPEARHSGMSRRLLRASREWAYANGCSNFASDRAGRIVIDRSFLADQGPRRLNSCYEVPEEGLVNSLRRSVPTR